MRQKIVISVLSLFLLLSLVFSMRQCTDKERAVNLTNQLSEELEVKTNKLGQQEASISVLETKNKKMFLDIQTRDSTIIWLQKTVKQYKGDLRTAIVLSNQTISENKTSEITAINDTVIKDSIVYIHSIYETSWNNEWEEGTIRASIDSIYHKIRFRNEYEITLGGVIDKWFKKRVYTINVLNLNPSTYTQELRSFSIEEKPRRFSLGIQAGYGLDLVNLKPVPYIGVGFSFNIVNLR